MDEKCIHLKSTKIRISRLFFILFYLCLYGCGEYIKREDNLNGKSIGYVLQKKGVPDEESTFLLESDTLYEYRYNLSNIFPNYKKEDIEIKELLWIAGKWKTVVWFYKDKNNLWISVDNMMWNTHEISF